MVSLFPKFVQHQNINSVCLKHSVGLWTSGSCQGVSRFHLCFVALLPITHAVKSVGMKCEVQCIVYRVWGNCTQQFKFNAEVSGECLLLILALSMIDTKAQTFLMVSSLLHRAFRRITLIVNQQMHYIKFHIKTLKITLTCFNPKVIIRELRCSLLK